MKPNVVYLFLGKCDQSLQVDAICSNKYYNGEYMNMNMAV